MRFIGVDLGWYGKPTGLAMLEGDGALRLEQLDRVTGSGAVLQWIDRVTAGGPAIIGVDAPIVIPNQTGSRPVERAMNSQFGRRHAGCHAANLGMKFAALTTGFSRELEARGFRHAAEIEPRSPGRYQIEVHPHAATINFFHLDRILKYKKGPVAQRLAELGRYRALLEEHLPRMNPPVMEAVLPEVAGLRGRSIKDAEDRLDAVLAACVAACWWRWGTARNRVYGTAEEGYIVVPELAERYATAP